jgi:hypothetical protein
MTSSSLLLWIAFGIALQVAIWLGIEFWRHWLEYQGLRSGVPVQAGAVLPAAPQFGALSEPASIAAWAGLRPFRVERRVVEDGAQTICSFYLVPEDGEALPSFLPGQFLTFRLDVSTAAGLSEQIIRCYSLSDAPRPDYYRVSIKRVPAPPVAMCLRAVPRATFTIRSLSAASCKCARRAAISILTAAMIRWC